MPNLRLAYFLPFAVILLMAPAIAQPKKAMESVVSVLPVWPGKPQGGLGASRAGKPGTAPEGSGVVVLDGRHVATAWHVVRPAQRIDVRLSDGRILPAKLVGRDPATDIALLKIETARRPIDFNTDPELTERVCAIANAYGLGLSITCGVVSAVNVSNARFNAIEDFIQTDAAANPGSSGGALVDDDGDLVGMMSAIFAAKADTNIGINFAISARLLQRVVEDLQDDGHVSYVSAGWQLRELSRAQRARTAGAEISALAAEGPATAAGVRRGDIVVEIADRRIRTPRDAVAALALVRAPDKVDIEVLRGGKRHTLTLNFKDVSAPTDKDSGKVEGPPPSGGNECPYPAAVCKVRTAVFPIESFDPLASAVRIAPDLLVTNRHAVGNQTEATVHTPAGPRKARVVATAYRGDLALLRVAGLPDAGLVLDPNASGRQSAGSGPYFAVGADVARKEIRVFQPGKLINAPASGAALGRLHVTSRMQPGVSGGALVDRTGRLVAIAVGGGEGRNEALPVDQVEVLLRLRNAADAETVHEKLGRAFEACAAGLDLAKRARRGQRPDPAVLDILKNDCRASENPVQHLTAGRYLAFARDFKSSISIIEAAVTQVPNSINARISLLVALQLAGRFEQMLPHARWLMKVVPADPQALRFGIQSGVWGGDKQLAEDAYKLLLAADPRQAQAARRFIDRPPPAPRQR